MTSTLDQLLNESVASGTVPHIYGAVVKGTEIVYEGSAGGSGSNRIYRIASMTKALTTAAVMQLVERGLVDLDALVSDYLPLDGPRVLEGFTSDGTPRLRPAARAPTIRELLTHTAGYAYGVWHPMLHELFSSQGIAALGPAGEERLTAPMVADPGTAWNYSIATDFVGRVVEEVSGADLDAYMKSDLLGPLGMIDTSFTLGKGEDDRLMSTHRRRSTGEVVSYDLPRPEANGFCSGGGLTSTPHDYLRFLTAILNGGTLAGARVLEAHTIG